MIIHDAASSPPGGNIAPAAAGDALQLILLTDFARRTRSIAQRATYSSRLAYLATTTGGQRCGFGSTANDLPQYLHRVVLLLVFHHLHVICLVFVELVRSVFTHRGQWGIFPLMKRQIYPEV